jgi:hypothetical protein
MGPDTVTRSTYVRNESAPSSEDHQAAFEDSMTREQKLVTDAAVPNVLEGEELCGKVKARGCADGRKKRLWKAKDETTGSSPTVRTTHYSLEQ